jgi:hypothetical protein
MEIEIIDIAEKNVEEYSVSFQSPFGSISAIWLGEAPEVGERYAVELEIGDMLAWGVDITLREDREYYIFERDGQKYFRGRIYHMDASGLLMLKIGTSLLMVSTTGEPLARSGCVEVKATNVYVYDEDI